MFNVIEQSFINEHMKTFESNNIRSKHLSVLAVTNCDINNGPGFRMTIWVSGCTHNCYACQNKHTHAYGKGHSLYDTVSERGALIDEILYTLELYGEVVTGVTISGGDPLDQSDTALGELKVLVETIKSEFPGKSIWLYTGCTWEDLSKEQMGVARLCDVVVDGKFDFYKKDVTLPFRGSSNQRLIDVKKTLKQLKPITLDDEKFKS